MYFYFVEIIKNLIKKTLCPLRSLVMEVKMDGSHNLYFILKGTHQKINITIECNSLIILLIF